MLKVVTLVSMKVSSGFCTYNANINATSADGCAGGDKLRAVENAHAPDLTACFSPLFTFHMEKKQT